MKQFSLALLALILALNLGCGAKQPKLISISGTLTFKGQPLDEVKIEFMPDPEKGGRGSTSIAETDSSGGFQMLYEGQKNKPGVPAGWNRVVLLDFKAMNSRENPIAPRVPLNFSTAAETPIRISVDTAKSDLKIELADYLK